MRILVSCLILFALVAECNAVSHPCVPFAYNTGNSPVSSANGMGEAGVALINGGSAYFNPAQIAFPLLQQKHSFSITPKKAYLYKNEDSNHGLFLLNGQMQIWSSDNDEAFLKRIDIGFYHYKNQYSLIWTDGSGATDYIEEANETINALTIGAGGSALIDFSVGLTVKLFNGPSDVGSNNNLILDFGILAGIPIAPLYSDYIEKWRKRLNFYPTIALSYSNVGEDFVGDGESWMHIRRLGTAARISLDRQGNYGIESLFLVCPSYETERDYMSGISDLSSFKKYGVELGIMETVALRLGNIERTNGGEYSTKGFSFNTRGLFRLFNKVGRDGRHTISKFLTMRANFQFSFAQRQSAPENINYYELKLMIY